MRKALAILLIPVFLLATSYGVAVTSHLCKGEVKEIGFDVKACCKDVNKGGCCKTQSELFKVKDNFVKTSFDFQLNYFVVLKELCFTFVNTALDFHPFQPKGNWDNAPPRSEEPLYIQYSSLII